MQILLEPQNYGQQLSKMAIINKNDELLVITINMYRVLQAMKIALEPQNGGK